MTTLADLTPAIGAPNPERPDAIEDGWLERAGTAVGGWLARRWRARRSRMFGIVGAVAACSARYQGLAPDALREEARELTRLLRRAGPTDALVAQAFALIRETSGQVLGMRHFDSQLIGGWVLLNGLIAEMETGEGKTLTATLPACTAALAGVPVHVITVNDYLVERDCAITRPVYEALGLSVAAVTAEMDHAARQAAYQADVVYCTNKTLVFDYLRDRIVLGKNADALHLQLEKLYGGQTRIRKLLLRGLCYCIVDEADSVLVDEARTPLIISAEVKSDDERIVAEQALEIARQMVADEHYRLYPAERRIVLTEAGAARVLDLCQARGGVWAMTLRREEMMVQALTALLLFHRDEHYLVREDKGEMRVQIIDEFTGRVMADRSWSQGLHQLIEVKEGLELTSRKESLARISYQRFFRRYLHLSGMTGTGSEVGGELGSVYGLGVVRVPTNRASRRVVYADRVFDTAEEKWSALVEQVATLHAQGVPVLLGTRSVAASEMASRMFAARDLPHVVLNAKQDDEEAAIVARAGERGAITIATNMAGRGTDIKLGTGVAELGGLHVILSERSEAGRIDRQLIGRCARQGDPGSALAFLSLEDSVLEPYRKTLLNKLARKSAPTEARKAALIRAAQKRTERAASRVRRALLRADQQLGNVLSFSGRPE